MSRTWKAKYPITALQNKKTYRQNAIDYFNDYPDAGIIWISLLHQTICRFTISQIEAHSFNGGYLFYRNNKGETIGLVAYSAPTAAGNRYGTVSDPCGLDFPSIYRLKQYIKKEMKE